MVLKSSTEFLPEKNKKVLCLDSDGEYFIGWYCDGVRNMGDVWTNGEYMGLDVTHWVELPELPNN